MDSDTEEPRSQMTVTKLDPSSPVLRKHKKKRKRVAAEENPEEPETVDVTIRVIPANPERIPPVVGYFPSGFDPTQDPDTKVATFRHKERGGRLQAVVTPKEANFNFVGTSYAGEAQAGECCNYGLGILDKGTGTLTILPIANNKILRLEPKVRGHNLPKEEPVSPVPLSKEEKAAKRTKLQDLYGTKGQNRKDKKMQALRQQDDPDTENDLEAIKQDMTSREDTEASEGHIYRNTPPFDASATTPQEAYPLDKIITTGEWKFLQDFYKLLEGGKEISQDSFPAFVCNRIHKLQLIQDKDKRYKLSCIFSYITHLIKFKDLHSMDGVSSAKAHRFPPIMKDKFSSMFDAVSNRLSTEKSNLLISYVLVLTLFADEFQTCPIDIAEDLRMRSADLRTHYEKLGCKLFKKKGIQMVTLPVPLKFPTMRHKRRR